MLAIACLITGAIAWLSYENGRTREAAEEQSSISRAIHDATADLVSAIGDAETGQRGYIITGRDAYLVPYTRSLDAIPSILERLYAATVKRPDQAQRMKELQPIVEAKLKELATTVELRRSKGFEAARAIVDTDNGRSLMDEIRSRTALIRDIAEARVVEYTADAEASAWWLRTISVIGSLVLLGLLGLSAWIIFLGLKHREDLYYQAAANAQHLRVTLDSIGDAVIATDAEERITFINPVAQQLTGWSETEALNKPIHQVFRIVNETTRATVENPLAKAIATGVVVGLANHTVLISKGGNEIPIDDSGAPIRSASGSILGAILVFRDISERRAVELQLRTLNEHLNEFVDGAAHDLRSPLRSVSVVAQLMAQRFEAQLGGDGRQFLEIIDNGVRRMESLLDGLLNYAQTSHFDLPEGPGISMEGALRSALDNLRADIDSAKASITVGNFGMLPVHDAHLIQLFQNLIGNAIKYRSNIVPHIHVECAVTETGWRIDVTDNGVGIQPEYREIIFKPFKRLHGEELPGSGIGLSTCQKIISGYGGRIWVESTPGEGSTFSFTIPFARGHGASAATAH